MKRILNSFEKLFIAFVAIGMTVAFFKGINIADAQNKLMQKELIPMNRTNNPSFSDTGNNKIGKLIKILVIGNSLTRHGIAENIGWTHLSGMAASSEENDFAHLILKQTEKLLPERNIRLRLSNLADFERNFSTFVFKTLDDLINYQPDILIFQLGENVSFSETNNSVLFEKKYIDLVNLFKNGNNPLIICTTPFFPSMEKNQIIERVALVTGSFLADLSHLPLLDKENYAKDESQYAGDRSVWKVDGIGIHPGDYGMKSIARQIFIIINASKERWMNRH